MQKLVEDYIEINAQDHDAGVAIKTTLYMLSFGNNFDTSMYFGIGHVHGFYNQYGTDMRFQQIKSKHAKFFERHGNTLKKCNGWDPKKLDPTATELKSQAHLAVFLIDNQKSKIREDA
jgi:hypothetical protein